MTGARPPSRQTARSPSAAADTGGDRAVSPVIGAVLMFALLVSLLGVLQMTAVPELTRGSEFQHNQDVQGDLIDFSGAVSRTAATGSGETVTIERGLRYTQRLFLINPPPVSGSLRTTEPDPVVIENAVAEGETGDVWNGTARTFADRALVYQPSYNEYDAAPRTVYRTGLVANEFESATLVAAGDGFVDGRRIDLTMLAGDYEGSGVERVGVETQPLSVPARTVTVTNDGAPITVAVPTTLPESRWEELLSEELVRNGGHVTSFRCERGGADACGRLVVRLQPGVGYQLRLAQVGIGSQATPPGPSYLTVDGLAPASVPAGTRERLGATVRDRFDNPVGGIEVEATVVSGPGSVSPSTDRSDSEGDVGVVYEAPGTVTGPTDVTVELTFGQGDARTVRYAFQVTGSGGGGGTSTSDDRIEYVTDSGEGGNNDDELQFGIENTGTSDIAVTGFSIDYDGTNKIDGDGPEVLIDGSTQGTADQPQGYNLDGTGYSLDTDAVIAGGETATITFANFRRTEFDSVSEASAADNDMTVRLTFADGSSTEFYFDVTTR